MNLGSQKGFLLLGKSSWILRLRVDFILLICHNKGAIHTILLKKLNSGAKHCLLFPVLLSPWVITSLSLSFLNCTMRLTEFTSKKFTHLGQCPTHDGALT